MEEHGCRICGSPTRPAGSKHSEFSGRQFTLRRCDECGFSFVSDPRTDHDAIYDDAYYRGQGADPLVDYVYEWAHPERTVRRYEWKGILRAVSGLTEIGQGTEWLDYGCGTGGLVRYLRDNGTPRAVGFEEGWAEPQLRERGLPVLSRGELGERAGSFDVVTAIEVIEHVIDPVPALQTMADLLRPGGLLFVTTGNAAPHFRDPSAWSYVRPEIHVSFFEPRTLAAAMTRAGLTPSFPGYQPGWEDIIKFKILKNLRRRRAWPLDDLFPWRALARLAHRRAPVSAHPIGRKPGRSKPASERLD